MDQPIFIDTTKNRWGVYGGDDNNFTVNMSGDGLQLDNTDSENYIALQ